MSVDYISNEVEKIINDKKYDYPLNLAMAGAWICGNFKGTNLKVLKVSGMSSLADYFILASASNITQAQAMTDNLLTQLKKHGAKSISKEGLPKTDWILLDLGDIIVHIFLDISRDIYDLDGLWRDAEHVDIPQEFYFSTEDSPVVSSESEEKDFF